MPLNQLGGNSNAMAIRYAAAYGYFNKEEDVVQAALTSMFTHRERTAREGAEFFARVTFRVIHSGLSPEAAIRDVSQESSPFIQSKVHAHRRAHSMAASCMSPTRPFKKLWYIRGAMVAKAGNDNGDGHTAEKLVPHRPTMAMQTSDGVHEIVGSHCTCLHDEYECPSWRPSHHVLWKGSPEVIVYMIVNSTRINERFALSLFLGLFSGMEYQVISYYVAASLSNH